MVGGLCSANAVLKDIIEDLKLELLSGGVEQRTFFLPKLMPPLSRQLRSAVTFRRATALQWIADFIELSQVLNMPVGMIGWPDEICVPSCCWTAGLDLVHGRSDLGCLSTGTLRGADDSGMGHHRAG